LRYKFMMIIVTILTMIGTVYLYLAIPKGFFPSEDTGFISATIEGPSDISFQAMYGRQQEIAEIVRKDPSVAYVNSTVGTGGPNPTNNNGRLFIALTPRGERHESSIEIIQRLRAKANAVTGMKTFFQNVENINITGRISKAAYQYTLQSSDTESLYRVGPEMLDKISKLDGLRDVNGDLYVKNPQKTLEIDREAAAVYGISLDQIRQELYDCFGTRQVATIYTASNDYQVILECTKDIQADPSGLSKIYLKTNFNGGTANGGVAAAAGSGINGATSPTGPAIPLS